MVDWTSKSYQDEDLEVFYSFPEDKQVLLPGKRSKAKKRDQITVFGWNLVSRLAYTQAPVEFLSLIAVQNFIDGVRDAVLQLALRLSRFKTLTTHWSSKR